MKQGLIAFCRWLSEQDFTNPDVNPEDWVEKYLRDNGYPKQIKNLIKSGWTETEAKDIFERADRLHKNLKFD